MTTESVPAPLTTAEGRGTALHPPRGPARRGPAALRRRGGACPRGPAAGLLAADACAPALTAALLVRPGWPGSVLLLLALVQPLVHACRGLYRPRLSPSALTDAPTVCGLALVQWIAAAEALTRYDSRYAVGWRELLLAVLAQTALCCAARGLVHRAGRRSAARSPRSALVVGHGPLAQQVISALHGHPEYGMRPVARVDTAGTGPLPVPAAGRGEAAAPGGALPPLTGRRDIARAVVRDAVRHVVFTQPPGADAETSALLALFARYGCRVWLVDGGAAAGNLWRRATGHDHLWGFSVRPLHSAGHRPVARAVKRVIDTALAALALVFAAPVMAVCALAVRIADGPGVIFRQERVGLDGEPFTLLKFRTLCPVDEHESATRWNVAFDRRMSTTGSVLRRTSLDELPQLWNVLRGDMSLVGPRPERPYFVARFSRAHPGYQARHRMPAGITGLAQIHGLRGDTSIEERARFDNHYIETWSPWQDVCILARTAASLFRLGGS
ncbi:exopolysaccharide biosynthesis polyprenyl glycosylphosphotransferase [Streptomyces jumonjinensis]|uniref:exopolysaccharide biosynthesis polyprenyl glycosylphosphotransferase n=2 Tax=Streptomyces jumonjinensis TaxID=1945 RepID=UPI00331813A3